LFQIAVSHLRAAQGCFVDLAVSYDLFLRVTPYYRLVVLI
jgi:hypothetical protein